MNTCEPVELHLPGSVFDTEKLRDFIAQADTADAEAMECVCALATILSLKLEDATAGNPAPDEGNFDQARSVLSVDRHTIVDEYFNGVAE